MKTRERMDRIERIVEAEKYREKEGQAFTISLRLDPDKPPMVIKGHRVKRGTKR